MLAPVSLIRGPRYLWAMFHLRRQISRNRHPLLIHHCGIAIRSDAGIVIEWLRAFHHHLALRGGPCEVCICDLTRIGRLLHLSHGLRRLDWGDWAHEWATVVC